MFRGQSHGGLHLSGEQRVPSLFHFPHSSPAGPLPGVSSGGQWPAVARRLLRETSDPYDWVLVLGGTNELGQVPERTSSYHACWVSTTEQSRTGPPKHSPSPSHSLCIYELGEGNGRYRQEKAKVNEGLKSYCGGSGGSSHFVDLWNGLPFGSLPAEEREKYWVDGLHMSPRGYDKMAGLIFDCLKQHI